MKTALAALFSAAALQAAPPPALVSVNVSGDAVTLTWSHPSARAFEIGCASPSRTNANQLWLEPVVFERATTNFTYTYKFTHHTNGCGMVVRAASLTTSVKTDWSNELMIDHHAVSSGPPDPSNPKNWSTRSTMRQANMPAIDVPADGKKLVLTWAYDGTITPNHNFRIWHSTDLKSWKLAETLPTTVIAGWPVPGMAYGFYRVSSTDAGTGTNIWATIQNLVMDP